MITSKTFLFLSLIFFLQVSSTSGGGSDTNSGAYKKCSTGDLYQCPNCGGIEVEDCFDCDGYVSTDNDHKICFDRRLFQPRNTDDTDHDDHYHYLWNDVFGAIVWFVMAGVATACGVGGGGIYVPLGILLFQFSPKQASGLSQASIFGASLGGILLNARNRHPIDTFRDEPGIQDTENEGSGRAIQKKHTDIEDKEYKANGGQFYTRPLINYDMALFLAPMEMAGAVLGVLVQKILPNWLYLLLAGLVLSFTAYKTYKKFYDVRAKEKKAEEEARQPAIPVEAGDSDQGTEEGIESASSMGKGTVNNKDGDGKEVQMDEEVQEKKEQKAEAAQEAAPLAASEDNDATSLRKKYLVEDMRQYPKEKMAALGVLWVVLFLLTLLKGGKGVESLVGIDCESPWYGVLIAFQFIWLFAFAIVFGIILVRKQTARSAVNYPYSQDDPIWDKKSLRFYGGFTFIAGIVAGLIGIGGGMVLGPLMIVMGIHPRVSSATTATMIVLTSSSVAVIFVTSGIVPWSYAAFYFSICLVGAIIGKSKIDQYIKRTGRASLLIFILASIIAFATIGCLFIMFWRLAEKDFCFDGFNKFCKIDDEEGCPVDRALSAIFQPSFST